MEKFFSRNIKYLRDKNNYSNSKLAEKLKVSQSTVSRWINNKMGATFDNAWDISNLFNVPLDKLYGVDLSKTFTDDFYDYLEANKHILNDDDKENIKFLVEKRKRKKSDNLS